MTDLMTVKQVATFFDITPNNVYRWAARGVLERVKVGGRTYFRVSDIQTLVRRPKMGRPRKAVQE